MEFPRFGREGTRSRSEASQAAEKGISQERSKLKESETEHKHEHEGVGRCV